MTARNYQRQRIRYYVRLLKIAVGLMFVAILAQITGWFFSGSLGLLTDAGHSSTDMLAHILTVFALLSELKPSAGRYTYGYSRFSEFVRLVNALVLLVVLAAIGFWAIWKLVSQSYAIAPYAMTLSASFAFLCNGITLLLLRQSASEHKTIRASYLHATTDFAITCGVLISAVVIFVGSSWFNVSLGWIDPLIAIGIAVYIGKETLHIVKDAFGIFMEAAPHEIDVQDVRLKLQTFREFAEVHDIHVWNIGSQWRMFSGHLVLREDIPVSKTFFLQAEVERVLKASFGISHVTIQFEVLPRVTGPSAAHTVYPKK